MMAVIDGFNHNEKIILFMITLYIFLKYPFVGIIIIVILYYVYKKMKKNLEYEKTVKLLGVCKSIVPNIYMDVNLLNFIILMINHFGLTINNKNGKYVVFDSENRESINFMSFCKNVDRLCATLREMKEASARRHDKNYLKRKKIYEILFFKTLKSFGEMIYVLPQNMNVSQFTRYQKLLTNILFKQNVVARSDIYHTVHEICI